MKSKRLNDKTAPLSSKSSFCPLAVELGLTFELCHLLLFTSLINWATAFFKQPWISKGRVDFAVAGKKEPSSHFYMCCAEHCGNYRNSLTHALDHQPYIRLKVLFLLEAILVEPIIPLSRKLSIVFVRCSRHAIELRSHKTLESSVHRKMKKR